MTTVRSGEGPVSDNLRKLVSWKAIAEYFECDVRTARRWEHERRLPVHRAPGGKRGYVYAYAHELDEWLQTGEEQRAGTEIAEEKLPPSPQSDATTATSVPQPPHGGAEQTTKQASNRSWLAHHQRLAWSITGAAVLLFSALGSRIAKSLHAGRAEYFSTSASSSAVSKVPFTEAENFYLRGRYFWNLRTPDGLAKAIDSYTQAIVIDPSFAEPYAGLAEAYELAPQFAKADLGDALEQAEKAAEKALQLNPDLAMAHRARAFALFFRDWDIAGSEAEFKRALALDPNSAQTHQWYASTLLERLEGPACIAQIDEALRLDPGSPAIAADAAFLKASFGDTVSGARVLKEIERSQQSLPLAAQFLSRIDFATGDFPSYIQDLHDTARMTRSSDDLALADAADQGWRRSGKRGMLEAEASVLKAAFERGSERGVGLGEMLLLLGRSHDALPYLRAAALEHHDIGVAVLNENPQVGPLLTDPGYRSLFTEIDKRFRGGHLPHPSVVPIGYRLPM